MSNKSARKAILYFSLYLCSHSYVKSGELDVGYDSKYVSEGRNNIAHGGITWLQLSHELQPSLSVIGLYGVGDNYDELNVSLVYSQNFAEIDYYFSLTRLEFFQDNAYDNELAFGAAYSFEKPFTLALDSTYSTVSDGAFVEFSLTSDWVLSSRLTLSPYIKSGLDFGYASDNKKGYNHSAMGAIIAYRHSEELGLYLVAESVLTTSQVHTETSKNNLDWLGLHLVYRY